MFINMGSPGSKRSRERGSVEGAGLAPEDVRQRAGPTLLKGREWVGAAQMLDHACPNAWAICKLHANQRVHQQKILGGRDPRGSPGSSGLRTGARPGRGPPKGEAKSHKSLPQPWSCSEPKRILEKKLAV